MERTINKHYDWLVVGGGLFGATFAHEMLSAGKSVLVVERRQATGGNIRCDKFNGVLMHKYGAHIFHTDKKIVWDFVSQYIPLTPVQHSPMARTEGGRMLSMPFSLRTFNALWPEVTTPQDARRKIADQTIKWQLKYPHPENLEQKALTLVGQDIYYALIKGYTEKQWNTTCDKLPSEIITRIPLRFSWDASYFSDRFVGIPEDGYNPLIDKLLEGADIVTGVDYLRERSALSSVADETLYTGCIDEFYGFQLGRLDYRSLRFDTKIEPVEQSQGCSVVNYTGKDVPWTRCIEHNQFAPNRYYEEIVKSYEYPADYGKDAEPYYPVLNAQNLALYRRYLEFSQTTPHIHFGGRLGMYEYMDMDDAIERAWQMAAQFIKR